MERKMKISDIPEIAALSTPEKILLLEDLWDSISSHEEIEVPRSHKAELDNRSKKYLSSKDELLTLDELQRRINKNK